MRLLKGECNAEKEGAQCLLYLSPAKGREGIVQGG